ncbi:MAG: tRNA (adenosine(37)-N6)-threonylcarbamoyltransferase complex transferase subunit TsaD [Bacteroidetes bacterium]|nr:tRNA (adenosine(37)-N6)-threonylcarbamoyltransferase complex transferase subunit TsaD [Bacteroidota bacterium]MCL5025657.1 tRNA (adenosine(37)-N6)-threonylcarbamoyltransferase complex transferase subunit TsaD [Chloroflexota bacterium]
MAGRESMSRGLVLGIESSCDETAAAVVAEGRRIVSNVVASQVQVHARFGGVVPEVASRQHLTAVVPVIREAMGSIAWDELAGVAVTYGPGLAGSLLVGLSAAKALAWAQGLALAGVNHLEAHLYANWLLEEEPRFPLLGLVVSGGHSDLVLMRQHLDYRLLGQTRDDAAGEAFDKVARILGLGYPGGPAIQQAAQRGDPARLTLPRAWLEGSLDFSFSGLKTAVLRLVERLEREPGPGAPTLNDVAAAFQESVVDVLAEKTARAAREYGVRTVILSGGVASNTRLREEVRRRVTLPVMCPPPSLCTDNAAMVAACGWYKLQAGRLAGLDLDVVPSLRLDAASKRGMM